MVIIFLFSKCLVKWDIIYLSHFYCHICKIIDVFSAFCPGRININNTFFFWLCSSCLFDSVFNLYCSLSFVGNITLWLQIFLRFVSFLPVLFKTIFKLGWGSSWFCLSLSYSHSSTWGTHDISSNIFDRRYRFSPQLFNNNSDIQCCLFQAFS